jgi:hypothetical protein
LIYRTEVNQDATQSIATRVVIEKYLPLSMLQCCNIDDMPAVVYLGETSTQTYSKLPPKNVITDYGTEKIVDGDASSTGCRTTFIESTSREIPTVMLEQRDGETVCSDCDTADERGHPLNPSEMLEQTESESVCSDCETQDEDGYPLNPSAYTCASSVTWWEGSMFEEVEVMTDDEDDLYGYEEVEVMTDAEDNLIRVFLLNLRGNVPAGLVEPHNQHY